MSESHWSWVLAGTRELPEPGRWALGLLRDALAQRGVELHEGELDGEAPGFIVGLAESDAVRAALPETAHRCPEPAESLLIVKPTAHRCVLAGRDAAGLAYAVTEAARAIELGSAANPLDDVDEAAEAPELAWRSIQLFRGNETLEEPWYFSETFWDRYLADLVRCRYNNLSLTFAHQSAYLAPPYPFHVELPEFPQVKAIDLSKTQRRRNLAMLEHISSTARRRGLHFTLGVWQQHDVGYGEPMVEGLTEDIRAQANALGLQRLLEQCPGIDGVQFRMNVESGVPEHEQAEYWKQQFEAIAAVVNQGRAIRVDLRAKGLANQTIALAQQILPDVVVSTKHWCEHLGQPYVMPAVQRVDTRAYRRYGTYDLLERPRTFPLIYRLWSYGTQRVLLWGDPTYVRRFTRSCHFGGEGFEVGAPLTNKGGRNEPGDYWPIIDDPTYLPYEYEYERYWLFYLLFGRIGYNADADARVWQRELRWRFGDVADAVEDAYAHASGVMPTVTVVLQIVAGLWGYWPELFAGQSLFWDIHVEPSDPTQFYGLDEYAEAALAGALCGKWTPFQTAAHLRTLAQHTRSARDRAAAQLDGAERPEWPTTRMDLTMLAEFADYHALRLEAGADWAIFLRNRDPARLLRAIERMRAARDHWATLVNAASPYHHDLVFGMPERNHNGHWRDRLELIDWQIDRLERQRTESATAQPTATPAPLPGELPGERALRIHYEPPASATPGADLPVRVSVESDAPVAEVICHHRPAMQTQPFRALPLVREGAAEVPRRQTGDDCGYAGAIPGAQVDGRFDLMLFFEVRFADGEAARRPDWRRRTPYEVIRTDG